MSNDSKINSGSTLEPSTGGTVLHQVGTGVGAAGGAAAGAAIGTAVGGPVGAVLGGAIGAATGALAGQSAAEALNPAAEDAYWGVNYRTREYVDRDRPYTEYRPAFQYGWESRARMRDRTFQEVENELERGWEGARGDSKLPWAEAKPAAHDAWQRLDRAEPVSLRRRGH